MRARGRRLRLTKEGSSVRRPHPTPPPRRTRVASAWASRLLPAVAAASAIEVALVLTPSCTCRKERGASGQGKAGGPCCQSLGRPFAPTGVGASFSSKFSIQHLCHTLLPLQHVSFGAHMAFRLSTCSCRCGGRTTEDRSKWQRHFMSAWRCSSGTSDGLKEGRWKEGRGQPRRHYGTFRKPFRMVSPRFRCGALTPVQIPDCCSWQSPGPQGCIHAGAPPDRSCLQPPRRAAPSRGIFS